MKLRHLSAMTLIALLVFSQLACGPKQLQAAAEAAKDLGGATRDSIAAVSKAYTQNLITLAQKDKLADILSVIAKGGQKGVDAIDALNKSGVTTLSGGNAIALNKLFDAEMVTPFLRLLNEIAGLSASASAAIQVSIASLRTILLLFSQKIGRTDVERTINAKWEVVYV